jgi:hypothetical protein
MRDTRELLTTIALLGMMLALAGCGGGASLAGHPATPGVTAPLTVTVTWSGTGSRYIPAFTQGIDIEVTAPDMNPVTATITRPENSATLDVPVGYNRVITLYGKDSNGLRTASVGRKTGVTIAPRVSNNVPITLGGAEDLIATPPVIPLGGVIATGAVEAVIESLSSLDRYDTFTFPGIADQQYTISYQVLDFTAYGDWDGNSQDFTLDASDAQALSYNAFMWTKEAGNRTLLPESGSFDFTPATTGTVTITAGSAENTTWCMYYRVTVTESGTADVGLTAE